MLSIQQLSVWGIDFFKGSASVDHKEDKFPCVWGHWGALILIVKSNGRGK